MLYLYQRWYNCQFKAQFSFKPCFPWPHLCCPRDINWPWVGRYQCIWKWNSNFWLLSSWNSWLQVVVEWKICLEELLGKHNEDGTCWEKKFHLRFTKFRKILPIHFLAKKNQILWKTWKQMHFFNLYVWSANYSDFSKVWQMKFRLWHVILTEIANMSPGQKNLESCQTNVLEQSLSSPLAFPILVNIKPYQKYTKITQNAVFNFFRAKFGVLPFVQECPFYGAFHLSLKPK